MRTFDLIVIGSGSGLDVAGEAVEHGKTVAVIDEGPFGGTCLNRGCIPSKMLIHSADVMEIIRGAHDFGIEARVASVDWTRLVRRVTEEIDGDARSIEEANRRHPSIAVYRERARFIGAKTLAVGAEEITAETIVIAAGTRPRVPDIPGLGDVPWLTSDLALRLPKQPRRLAMIGGGFVAAELAHFFGALGTEVTIIARGPRLLQNEDEDISRRFTEVYGRKHRLLLNSTVSSAERRGDGLSLDVASRNGEGVRVKTDALLLAAGRVPNTDRLAVQEAGVTVDEHGFIRTDEYLRTNVSGIWALGDIVGRYLLKHSANLEAAYVANNVLRDQLLAVDYRAMPHAIFAWPQVAAAGMTEQQAERAGVPYVAATYPYDGAAYGASIEDHDGLVKVLAHSQTGEILGCHILGTEASVLIQEVVNLMRANVGISGIRNSIYVHPALPEVVQRAFASLDL